MISTQEENKREMLRTCLKDLSASPLTEDEMHDFF